MHAYVSKREPLALFRSDCTVVLIGVLLFFFFFSRASLLFLEHLDGLRPGVLFSARRAPMGKPRDN